LFDSSYEDVNKTYGKYDENRAAQNGYQAFPFKREKKEDSSDFLRLSLMSYGDKVVLFIPSIYLRRTRRWCYTAKRNPDFLKWKCSKTNMGPKQ
jgi:hypothetical protein